MKSDTSLCELTNVSVSFGEVDVLKGVSVSVYAGEIVGLFGHNGAGKSTVLKVLMGEFIPQHGLVTMSVPFTYVPQGERIFPSLSVEENICVASGVCKVPQFVLELFPSLKNKLQIRAGSLSGGEQQMVALGRGLIHKPKLLLLDEPSLGLAPKLVREVYGMIEHLRSSLGIGVLVIEHNREALMPILDRGYVMDKGSIVEEIVRST